MSKPPRVNSYGVLIDEKNFGALAEYAAQLARDVDKANARAAAMEQTVTDLRGAMETCAEAEAGYAIIARVRIAELERKLETAKYKIKMRDAKLNESEISRNAIHDERDRYRDALESYTELTDMWDQDFATTAREALAPPAQEEKE